MAAALKEQNKETTIDIVFGIHPIVELLKAKRRSLRTVYTTKPVPKAWNLIERLLPTRVPVHYVSRDKLTSLAGNADHQGVVAVAGPFQIRKKAFDPKHTPFLVLLDGVQDPRNVGAIIRSAYCTGAGGVILCKKRGAPLNAVAVKASAGLAEHMEIYEATSAIAAAQEIKAAGYNLYLAALGGKDARTVTFVEPMCIVIGSEGTGISPQMLPLGQSVMLAQKTADISYNASVAAGILLFMASSANKKV